MGMVVRTNTMSTNAYRQLGMNNTQLAKSLEKLSSGFRINRAGDDASGLAISEKMKAQIKGLEQASANAQDGISLVQTAEGALTEVHSMLNRMVELANKSANGTIQNEVDRDAIQTEVKALNDEITRIASSTNFNGINLLDGSLGGGDDGVKVTIEGATISGLSSTVKTVAIDYTAGSGSDTPSSITGINVDSDGNMTIAITAHTGSGAQIDASALQTYLQSNGYKDATITGTFTESGTDVTAVDTTKVEKTAATIAGTRGEGFEINFEKGKTGLTSIQLTAVDASLNAVGATNNNGVVAVMLDQSKSYTASDINEIFADAGVEGMTVSFSGEQTGTAIATGLGLTTAQTVTDGTGSMASGLNLQVGDTNDDFNHVTVKVDDLSAEGLGIKGLDVSTQEAAGKSIQTIKDAINKVSTNRGNLGALQNRLEHAIANLDTTAENMDAANSRIRDTDMAKEMMNYTKMNILSQAAQAMLAQANQQPQNILQLLQ
jgi:flagellin